MRCWLSAACAAGQNGSALVGTHLLDGGIAWAAADEWAAIREAGVRRTGLLYRVTIRVEADPAMPLHRAHVLSGKVKGAIGAAVQSVLVHMEPDE